MRILIDPLTFFIVVRPHAASRLRQFGTCNAYTAPAASFLLLLGIDILEDPAQDA